jgi:hypothetical protein
MSLAVCKPLIRKRSNINDIVVGIYDKSNECHGIPYNIFFIGVVHAKMSFTEYNKLCLEDKLMTIKIPNDDNLIGDCLYDAKLKKRQSPYNNNDIKTDLSSNNVLLFKNFKYMGDKGLKLSIKLKIIYQMNNNICYVFT